MALHAATNSDLSEIPPLIPPRPEIPAGFWEQHGGWLIAGGCIVAALAAHLAWLLTRPKQRAILPPAIAARKALDALVGRPEDGLILSRVSQVLRHYVLGAFALPSGELTTAEFCKLIEQRGDIGTELGERLSKFLRQCDERKFSPPQSQPPLEAVNKAIALIDLGEKRKQQLSSPK